MNLQSTLFPVLGFGKKIFPIIFTLVSLDVLSTYSYMVKVGIPQWSLVEGNKNLIILSHSVGMYAPFLWFPVELTVYMIYCIAWVAIITLMNQSRLASRFSRSYTIRYLIPLIIIGLFVAALLGNFIVLLK